MAYEKLNEVKIVEQLSDSEFTFVVMADGSIGRITKKNLLGTINHSFEVTTWGTRGWHRIAIGTSANSSITSAIVNIGNTFSSKPSSSSCFYYSGSGYGERVISMIGKVGALFSRARVIYKPSTVDPIYIDVYYDYDKTNNIYLSVSSIINLRFSFNEDTLATIPEGYSVQEFNL